MKKPVILCVDDEQISLVALKLQFQHQFGNDYQIEVAESGEEALEIVEELSEAGIELPVVISDQMMPGITGDELLKQIHAIAPDTLKILLTGQADASAVGNAVNNAKLYRYIAKPWEPTDLNLTITEAIRSYFQQKELAHLTTQLAERNRELQNKNELLSIIVHDLKNPLSVIQGYSEMIIKFDKLSPVKLKEFADQIFKNCQQMFDLIKKILEINAIESGKMNLLLKKIDIMPLLQFLVSHYKKIAEDKGIILHFQSVETEYHAIVDETLIRQVYDNLISNAIKYSPHGKSIYICLKQRYCEIQDEGPGLSESDQKKLFTPFSRLTPKPTGGEHSTGLGLFIVKKLVESMNGKVWCESTLGQGTTFFVEFP